MIYSTKFYIVLLAFTYLTTGVRSLERRLNNQENESHNSQFKIDSNLVKILTGITASLTNHKQQTESSNYATRYKRNVSFSLKEIGNGIGQDSGGKKQENPAQLISIPSKSAPDFDKNLISIVEFQERKASKLNKLFTDSSIKNQATQTDMDNLVSSTVWPNKERGSYQYSFGRRNIKIDGNQVNNAKFKDFHDFNERTDDSSRKTKLSLAKKDKLEQVDTNFQIAGGTEFHKAPFKDSPISRKYGLKEAASRERQIYSEKRLHNQKDADEKCDDQSQNDHKEENIEDAGGETPVSNVEKHHHHYHHHHHLPQKQKAVKKVPTPPVHLEIQIKGKIKSKEKKKQKVEEYQEEQQPEEKIVVKTKKEKKKDVVMKSKSPAISAIKHTKDRKRDENHEHDDESSHEKDDEDSSASGESKSTGEQGGQEEPLKEEQNKEGEEHENASGTEHEKPVEDEKDNNDDDDDEEGAEEESIKNRETQKGEHDESKGTSDGGHHHDFGHVINTSLVPGYDSVINDEAPIIVKEEEAPQVVSDKVEAVKVVEVKEKVKHKEVKKNKIKIGEKKTVHHEKKEEKVEEKKLEPVVAQVVEEKKEKVEKPPVIAATIQKEKEKEQQPVHQQPQQSPQVSKVEEKGEHKKEHKHQHIELHAHKHYEQHQHINLHDHKHDDAPEEQHPLIGHEEVNQQEEIPHELLNQPHHDMIGGNHQQHEPIPIKEQWIVPEMHELPAHGGGGLGNNHHHLHPGAIVIEDHSDLEQHQPHLPVEYKEEVVMHPHGFGLTPSGHSYMGAYSTTSSTHLSANATTKKVD